MHSIATQGPHILAITPDDSDIDHAAVNAMADLGLTGAYTVTTAMQHDDGGWRRTDASREMARRFDGSVVVGGAGG